MSNRAATLASEERRKTIRLVSELAVGAQELIDDVLYGMGPEDDLEPARLNIVLEKLTDLDNFVGQALIYVDRWGAFLEMANERTD